MRALRGLYVIRGGVGVPRLAESARADEGPDTDQPAGNDEPDAADAGDDAGDGAGGDDQAPSDGRLATLEVMFSRFNTWYEIDSFWEGRFLERIAPGAFRRTIDQRGDQVKILFNHGFDFSIGDKILGVPERLEERDEGPYLEAGLLDTSYNRDLLPGLRAGGYGSSFMFEVLGEDWAREPEQSEHNPDALPERTITEVRLYEAGPVTWPANPEATAGARGLQSGMDWFAEQLRSRDADRYDQLLRSFKAFRALHGLGDLESTTPRSAHPETSAPGTSPARHVDGVSSARRKRALRLLNLVEV